MNENAGISRSNASPPNEVAARIARELRTDSREKAERFRTIDESSAREPRAAGKWSRCEILGHLIDSAVNNHHRFVRAQLASELRFPKYEQDEWVRVQAYRRAEWSALVDLWERYNEQLAWVIAQIPVEAMSTVCFIGEYEPVSLEFLLTDYVDHLRHHAAQILDESSD